MFSKKNVFIAILLLTLLIPLLSVNILAAEKKNTLLVYSGAGLRKPMDAIGIAFEKEYGVKVNYTYAGSAQNLSQLQMVGEGDIYVPGSRYYYEQAAEKGLTIFEKEVAYHIPVIAVPKGNPANINSLDDLKNNDVKVTLGDERSAAIGRISQKILSKNNILEAVNKNVVAKAATVNELVIYINMKQADASIIWEDNVADVKGIDIVRIDKKTNEIKTIPVSVLSYTKNKDLAIKFAEFVASKRGKEIYESHGFKTVDEGN